MKRILIVIALALLASPALAQQSQQRITAAQILQSQIGQLAVQNAANAEQIAALQEQLATAQARIRELEAAQNKPVEKPTAQ